jgi:PBP1b-binding outer membrane lipoprotein LpoB
MFINSCNVTKREKNIFLNIDTAIENIVIQLLQPKNIIINENTLFFAHTLKNDSTININAKKITDIIKNKIKKYNDKIIFISEKKIDQSKKKLGLSNERNVRNTSIAILLSRNNHAKYYLESNVSGYQKPFLLTLKLILTKTGEIIFLKTEKFNH